MLEICQLNLHPEQDGPGVLDLMPLLPGRLTDANLPQ